MLTEDQKFKVEVAVEEVIAKAEKLYGVDFGFVDVLYDLKGSNAVAQAVVTCRFEGYGRSKNILPGTAQNPRIRINPDALNINWDDMINDTLPHEVAHLVTYYLPHIGKNHDAGWKSICRALGGTGNRTTTKNAYTDLTPARKVRLFVYEASCGTEVVLKAAKHNKVYHGGELYKVRRTGGLISKSGFKGQKL